MKTDTINYKDIPGWGADIDPENEPTYPMKNYTGDDHKRLDYVRSEQQAIDVELLKSNERPVLPAVFGNSVPPSGISGAIRRWAFRHSEDRYRHWIPLIIADRINVVEGLIDDFRKGKLPNIFLEKGLRAEIRYNAPRLTRKIAITMVLGAIVLKVLKQRSKKG